MNKMLISTIGAVVLAFATQGQCLNTVNPTTPLKPANGFLSNARFNPDGTATVGMSFSKNGPADTISLETSYVLNGVRYTQESKTVVSNSGSIVFTVGRCVGYTEIAAKAIHAGKSCSVSISAK